MRKEISTAGTIVRLLRTIHIHPGYFIVPVVFSAVAALFEGMSMGLLIPLLNGLLSKDFSFIKQVPGLEKVVRLFPAEVLTSDRLLFSVLMGTFIGVFVLKTVCKYLASLSMGYLANRSLHHLRKQVFNRFLHFGKLYFDLSNVGHHNSLINDFTANALRPLFAIDKYVSAFFSLITYLVIMLSISWKLTLFTLPLFLCLHIVVRTMITRLYGYSHGLVESSNALSKKTIEILSTMTLIKSYHSEELELQQFSKISDRKAKLHFRTVALEQLMGPIQEMITLLGALVLFAAMMYVLVNDDSVTPSAFIVYFYVVLNAASRFSTVTGFRGALANAAGPVEAVDRIFHEEEKYRVPSGERSFAGLEQGIELKGLSFSYPGGRTVLDDVSFTMEKGKMTAIVGPTGTGKTTIISLLMRFYDCPPGSIIVDGTDIREFSTESIGAHIGLVTQETLLLHETLRYNITYGLPPVSEDSLMEAIRRARLEQYVSQLPEGLDTIIGDRGVKLSGGEKQRVSIARALLKAADILILDEATSALDSATERLIQEAIDDVVVGRTAIVIAHRLSTIQHADRIVVLDQGHVTEQGTLNELLAKDGVFKSLWEQQKFS